MTTIEEQRVKSAIATLQVQVKSKKAQRRNAEAMLKAARMLNKDGVARLWEEFLETI